MDFIRIPKKNKAKWPPVRTVRAVRSHRQANGLLRRRTGMSSIISVRSQKNAPRNRPEGRPIRPDAAQQGRTAALARTAPGNGQISAGRNRLHPAMRKKGTLNSDPARACSSGGQGERGETAPETKTGGSPKPEQPPQTGMTRRDVVMVKATAMDGAMSRGPRLLEIVVHADRQVEPELIQSRRPSPPRPCRRRRRPGRPPGPEYWVWST
jgi:hypothetical protein